tara:strand:+ start:266 stop:526 length:261 start_codon:yes stop_codon:yes gene_type:complete
MLIDNALNHRSEMGKGSSFHDSINDRDFIRLSYLLKPKLIYAHERVWMCPFKSGPFNQIIGSQLAERRDVLDRNSIVEGKFKRWDV